MSWAVGFDDNWNRDVGYGVPCVCDHPDCSEAIDRGLSYVCGHEPYGGNKGCGLFFCVKHKPDVYCERCYCEDVDDEPKPPFAPKPDVREWIDHKNTDPSWAQWRLEQEAVRS